MEMQDPYSLFTYFYSICKETTQKPSKVVAAKKKKNVCVLLVGASYFDKRFLVNAITGRHCLLCKFIVTLRFFLTAMLVLSFKEVVYEKSAFHVISTMLITKFQT